MPCFHVLRVQGGTVVTMLVWVVPQCHRSVVSAPAPPAVLFSCTVTPPFSAGGELLRARREFLVVCLFVFLCSHNPQSHRHIPHIPCKHPFLCLCLLVARCCYVCWTHHPSPQRCFPPGFLWRWMSHHHHDNAIRCGGRYQCVDVPLRCLAWT